MENRPGHPGRFFGFESQPDQEECRQNQIWKGEYMLYISSRQARQFILLKQGLLGGYRFSGKQGALDYVRQAGCIQFDPVDACGKNAELTLQSRVKGFTKQMLYDLLYTDRALVDYPDKQLAIFPVEDWPYFARYRNMARENAAQFPDLPELEAHAKTYIRENGPVCSDELPVEGEIHWHSSIHWSGNWHGKSNAARSVLEQSCILPASLLSIIKTGLGSSTILRSAISRHRFFRRRIRLQMILPICSGASFAALVRLGCSGTGLRMRG